MERILKIVYQRNKERKLLTENDVKKIYQILIEVNNCKSIDNLDFSEDIIPSDGTIYGAYLGSYFWDPKEKQGTVSIYKNTLHEYLDTVYETACEDMNYIFEGTKIDTCNWYYLNTIFHEFSHAMDQDSMNKRKRNTGTKLVKISDKLEKIKDFYENNYGDMPIEIKARNKANLDSLKIYNDLPSEFISDRDKAIYGLMTLVEMQSTYLLDIKKEIIQSPSERLYNNAEIYNFDKFKINGSEFNKLVHNSGDLTLYERLLWGLPISYDEYGNLTLLQATLGNGNNIEFVKKLQRKKK